MTKLFVCAVRDTATETFGRPIFVNHSAQAVRSFSDVVSGKDDTQDQIYKHPSEFELWELGTFEDTSGVFDNRPSRLIRGVDIQQPARPANFGEALRSVHGVQS